MSRNKFLAVVPQLCCQLWIIRRCREIWKYIAVFEVFSRDPIHLRTCGKITCGWSSLFSTKTLLVFKTNNLAPHRRQDLHSTLQNYSKHPNPESYQSQYKLKPCSTTICSISSKRKIIAARMGWTNTWGTVFRANLTRDNAASAKTDIKNQNFK